MPNAQNIGQLVWMTEEEGLCQDVNTMHQQKTFDTVDTRQLLLALDALTTWRGGLLGQKKRSGLR